MGTSCAWTKGNNAQLLGRQVMTQRETYVLHNRTDLDMHHTSTHCNTLQHTATHCNTLQHTATHCNTLQHTAVMRKKEKVFTTP